MLDEVHELRVTEPPIPLTLVERDGFHLLRAVRIQDGSHRGERTCRNHLVLVPSLTAHHRLWSKYRWLASAPAGSTIWTVCVIVTLSYP